jgi:hypothetical protein
MEAPRLNLCSKNGGQATIEAVLLATVMVGVFMFATKTLREKQVVQKMTNKSVTLVKHMSEYGSWKDECKPAKGSSTAKAALCHPNSIARALSSDPQ